MSVLFKDKWFEAIISALVAFLTALSTASCTAALI